MKNKQIPRYFSNSRFTLPRLSLLMVAGVLLSLMIFSAHSSALPAGKYRYYASQCGGSDVECFKYSAEAGVYRGYRGTLNRNPDSGGAAFWKARLQNGTSSLTDFANSLISSSEWRNRYQSINNSQFVNQTYQFVLKRNPDSSGYNYWLGELNSGKKSRAQMVANMLNSSESASVHHSGFMNYYRPPAPAPQPNPTPAPTPSPRPNPSPSPSRPTQPRAPANTGPVASNVSQSGMQITDLTISEQDYRSAVITWTTSKPSTSKINFSTAQDDLYNEILKEEPVTSHSIRLEGSDLQAGRHYYFRITADDGSGPVTVDSEFDTKSIAVIIKVTNEDDEPVADALVLAGDKEATTDTNGEATLELPEGTISILAQKDELSKEIEATIELPQDENTQRITLAISKSAPPTATRSNEVPKKSNAWMWLLILIPLIGAVIGFLFWRRRNQQKSQAGTYFGDALEAENYNDQVIPSTPADQLPITSPELDSTTSTDPVISETTPPPPPMPEIAEPEYLPVENPALPHHASLPELVGRYGSPPVSQEETTANPEVPSEPTSPTGQHIPTHVSLKDLVSTPKIDHETIEPDASIQDLPTSPVHEPETAAPDKPEHGKPEDNNLLTIKH